MNLLVSGDPDKGRPLAEQETLATSINRLVGLLGQAQQYVDDVVVSNAGLFDVKPQCSHTSRDRLMLLLQA